MSALKFLTLTLGLAGSAFAQLTAEYRTVDDWGSGFQGEIRIHNGSSQPFESWRVDFDFDRTIETIWEATILSRQDGHYAIGPTSWNATIPVGGTLTFGFVGKAGNLEAGPANISLNGVLVSPNNPGGGGEEENPGEDPGTDPEEPGDPSTVTVTLNEIGRWSGGFSGQITLANAGSKALANWKLAFALNANIDTLWGSEFKKEGAVYVLNGYGGSPNLPASGSVTVGFTAQGMLLTSSVTSCHLNDAACVMTVTLRPLVLTPSSPITIDDVDPAAEGSPSVTQFTIPQETRTYGLRIEGRPEGQFSVTSNHPGVVEASINAAGQLEVRGVSPGRASLRIREEKSAAVRFVGVRVRYQDGTLPGLPNYLSLGSVSEDTGEHLGFWQAFEPGPRNRRVDIRYIYLNGGPYQGWNTWGNANGSRASSYIRYSRELGMIPFFVFYNIPDGAESYELDLRHAQSAEYMGDYYKNLKLALDIINRESPDDAVGIVLEPDFIGYLAQNANQAPTRIFAATYAVYDSGVLDRATDPEFPDTITGLVEAINYVINKHAPQVFFGWQVNLWASPPGGWTAPVPGLGIAHLTETQGVTAGRAMIANEARAITQYYLDAGVATHGASFISIDKYGLDGAAVQGSAANDPASSFWFWNNTLWQNYLVFVDSMHRTSRLPVVLWQLPVGHINSTTEVNPYRENGEFIDLGNTFQKHEDSAPTFFFGDTFVTTGARKVYFGDNAGGDGGLIVQGDSITWRSHMQDAAAAGVVSIMFGAGVGASTTNVGAPPTDDFWWMTKATKYLDNPVPLKE